VERNTPTSISLADDCHAASLLPGKSTRRHWQYCPWAAHDKHSQNSLQCVVTWMPLSLLKLVATAAPAQQQPPIHVHSCHSRWLCTQPHQAM